MSASDAVEEFERDVLEANVPLAALHEAAGVSGDARMRVLATHVAFPSWPGVTSARALRHAAQEAEITAALDEYASSARPLLRPADQERWELLVAEMQRRSGEGFLADELGRSAVGASLLCAKLGGGPHRVQQRAGIDCACGYAVDGLLPQRLCPECCDVLLRRWVAEERRLLRAMPAYAEDVAQVIDDVAQQQTKVFESHGEYLDSEAFGRRKAGGRRLARLGRRHRAELAGADLRRWTSFIEPLSRASTTSLRSTVQKVHKRGLGAAALTELGVRADAESIKAFVKDSEKRTKSSRRV
ncbi:hypothetical protein [Microbacterium sp.]|uniref:hypothetical protein n=1 Tax=Microbacterium sp. TaxID=51671 RepID=UPI0026146272|nr:hypothetical protein [Microbacterium sp.]MCV0336504.1 hypothetical protein [Microbacterium sp.]MCV0376128.1 hypothetical protein [Microbacterium sp.]MCV0390072.1 hypothetical protein [Microbacterium sp.]MCV0417807.1 hypothetical protein [Microbacterium sp.]MCV0422525.1 hypothetical protein [Microbacterium sp.]